MTSAARGEEGWLERKRLSPCKVPESPVHSGEAVTALLCLAQGHADISGVLTLPLRGSLGSVPAAP